MSAPKPMVPLLLTPRTTYINGKGTEVHIAGLAKSDKGYWWSVQGDWYTVKGEAIGYDKDSGHYVLPPSDSRLVSVASDQSWWSERVITDGCPIP